MAPTKFSPELRRKLARNSEGLWRVMCHGQLEQRQTAIAGYFGFENTKSLREVMFSTELMDIAKSWLKLRSASFNLTCPRKESSTRLGRSRMLKFIHHGRPPTLTLNDIRNAPTGSFYTSADFNLAYLLTAHYQLKLIEHPDLRDVFEHNGGGAALSGNKLSAFGISLEDWHRALMWLMSFAHQVTRAKESLKTAVEATATDPNTVSRTEALVLSVPAMRSSGVVAIATRSEIDGGDYINTDEVDGAIAYLLRVTHQNAKNAPAVPPVFWTDNDLDTEDANPSQQDVVSAPQLGTDVPQSPLTEHQGVEDDAEQRPTNINGLEERDTETAGTCLELAEPGATEVGAIQQHQTPEQGLVMMELRATQVPFEISGTVTETTEQSVRTSNVMATSGPTIRAAQRVLTEEQGQMMLELRAATVPFKVARTVTETTGQSTRTRHPTTESSTARKRKQTPSSESEADTTRKRSRLAESTAAHWLSLFFTS